jgi:hypothetical protein
MSIGLSKDQALGAMGGLAGESGRSLKTSAFNASDPNGGSYGIGQWHSERRTGLESFAKDSKYGIDDFRTQMDYVSHELQTTHKDVLGKMKEAPNRYAAAKTWTQKYERPKKEYEFVDKRAKNADYFAGVLDKGPKSPQEAADASNAFQGSLTGAVEEMSYGSPAMAYRDPQVTTRSRKAQEPAGPFETMFGGISDAVSGVASFSEAPAGAKSSKQVASDAGDRTQTSKPSAFGDFFGETSTGAVLGTLVGGLFGGPVGAIAGGLVGQGINKALSSLADQNQEDADNTKATSLAGGFGRALDNTVGGIGALFGDSAEQEFAKAGDPGMQKDSNFPNAPNGGKGEKSGNGYGSLNDRGKSTYGSSGQFHDAVNSGKGGLW